MLESTPPRSTPIRATPSLLAADPDGPRLDHRGESPDAGRGFTASCRSVLALRFRDDDGAATAEYAIATLAAVGFAGLLVVILRSDQVRSMLTDLIERALTVAG